MREGERKRWMLGRVALSMALSALVHLMIMVLLVVAGSGGTAQKRGDAVPENKGKQRVLRIARAEKEQQKKEEKLPFAKTDPDREEQTPAHADFVGARDSKESSSEFAPKRRSDAPLPTQNGEESEEVVTSSRRAQRGPLEDNRISRRATPPPAPPAVATAPPPPQQRPTTERGSREQARTGTPGIPAAQLPPKKEAGADTTPIRLATQQPGEGEEGGGAPIRIQPAVAPIHTPAPGRQGVVYDPSLADSVQPSGAGFRTHERLTRSTGRFVVGSRPSLNVASTPRGRYEEEIYRRIAYFWYRACDEHRGDIIPGSVVISLRINTGGSLENMELVRRRGASVIQQSFTFGAIRNASLPPMPRQVQREIHGDLLELIFTFNFD